MKTILIELTLLTPVDVKVGRRFSITGNGVTVGTGVVRKIIE